MAVGPQETVLAPVGSRILCGGVVAVGVVVLGSLVAWGRLEPLLRAAPAIALVVTGAIVLFWLPEVRVGPSRVEVVNPFRSFRVTWPAIREIGRRWSLTLYTDVGRIEAWAAPAPGPLTGAGREDRLPLGRGRQRQQHAGGSAATIVAQQWESYREDGLLGATEGTGVERTWHPVRIAVMSALTVLTVVGLAWP